MNTRAETFDGFNARDRVAVSNKAIRQTFFGGLTLAFAGSVCVWILNASLTSPVEPAAPPAQKVTNVKLIPARVVLDQYASLFDSTSSLGAPSRFAVQTTFESRWAAVSPEQQRQDVPQIAVAATKEVQPPPNVVQEVAEAIPLPTPRPASVRAADAGPSREDAERANKVASLAPPPQQEKQPSIFEKLFGRFQPAKQVLAYASPDGGLETSAGGRYDRFTAVYDISAHTVYMPDGRKLEAHSGLGEMLDDPRYVDRRMRGATPPATYDLKLRESLFHGVEAIRLTPVDSGVYGRSGLLAHTYMLGPNGDSNGCVSFRDYNAFLQAFKRQEIRKLVVVAKL